MAAGLNNEVGAAKCARTLIKRHGSLRNVFRARHDMKDADGQVANILNAVGDVMKTMAAPAPLGARIASSMDAVRYLHDIMIDLEREELRVLFLCTKGTLIGEQTITQGSLCEVPVYAREILRAALQANAASFIAVHNHPSGDPRPSKADLIATNELLRAGRQVGVPLVDHIIIAEQGWASLVAPDGRNVLNWGTA